MNSAFLLFSFILVLACYLAILQGVAHSVQDKRKLPLLAIVVLFIYLCAVGFIGLLYFYFGYDDTVLYAALCLFAGAGLGFIVYVGVRHKSSMSGLHVMLFLILCAAIGYLTIFTRIGTVDKSIRMQPFERLTYALETGSFEKLGHDLANMAMFIPLGFLIPLMNRRHFRPVSYAFLFGLIVSTLIETTQLITHLGECDINDVISNSIGMVIGHLSSLFVLRVKENWRI